MGVCSRRKRIKGICWLGDVQREGGGRYYLDGSLFIIHRRGGGDYPEGNSLRSPVSGLS